MGNFKKLLIWQESMDLVKEIYIIGIPHQIGRIVKFIKLQF